MVGHKLGEFSPYVYLNIIKQCAGHGADRPTTHIEQERYSPSSRARTSRGMRKMGQYAFLVSIFFDVERDSYLRSKMRGRIARFCDDVIQKDLDWSGEHLRPRFAKYGDRNS